jgi:hypothetical protein
MFIGLFARLRERENCSTVLFTSVLGPFVFVCFRSMILSLSDCSVKRKNEVIWLRSAIGRNKRGNERLVLAKTAACQRNARLNTGVSEAGGRSSSRSRPILSAGSWQRGFLGLTIILIGGTTSDLRAESRRCKPPAAKAEIVESRPRVLYTDILSGPTSGGEGGLGIYLSIFGRNFTQPTSAGTGGGGHNARVFIGGHPVANYRYAGVSAGRPDIQQITVQVGRLGNVAWGRPLAIQVEVNGLRSNSDITFTPNPGNIYFVDNVNGDDATGRAGDIVHPFRSVQTSDASRGLWPHVKPGDFVVMHGKGLPWEGSGVDGYFLRFQTSGTAPRGITGSGPITLMGYPGEDVFINETYAASSRGAIAARSAGPRIVSNGNSPKRSLANPNICEQNRRLFCSQWVVVANLRVEGGGKDGAIDLETGGNNWRIVNNILSASTAHASARSGGIAGDGLHVAILGNTIRDINSPDPGLQNHGIYIDGPGSYRIDYNYIHDVPGGSGFQVYGDQTATGSFATSNVSFSHNWVDHVAKYCINFADNSARGFSAFDNVLAYCGMAGLRVNSRILEEAKVYNNTFYATDSLAGDHYGAIVIDSKLKRGALEVRNNIFVPRKHMPYMGGDAALTEPNPFALFTNNLYFGGNGSIGFDSASLIGDPAFADSESCDFRLSPHSGAIGRGSAKVGTLVTDDFDFTSYPKEKSFEIGAYRLR